MIHIDVLCTGFACYDLVYGVDRHPEKDEKMFASSFISCGGGPAANAAFTAARLGFTSAFAGYLGNDIYGEKHLKEFEQQGVITELIVRGADQTPLSCIFVKPDGKRTIINYRKKIKYLSTGSIDFKNYTFKVILFDGYEPDIAIPLAQYARSKNIKTILDAGSLHEGTKKLIDVVDYLIASEIFARDFTKENDEEKAIKKLAAYSSKAVITLGERGGVWYNKPDYGRFSAFPVKVLDTTGCGDAFHGAFAAGVADGMLWQDLLIFSSATAALCAAKKGGRLAIPTRRDVIELIKDKSDFMGL
jgi:sulfofructose kinase